MVQFCFINNRGVCFPLAPRPTLMAAASSSADALNDKDEVFGDTALIRAVKARRIDEIKRLISAGAGIDSADNWGRTALIWAARLDLLEALNVLIEAGAGIELTDRYGKTAWVWATDVGSDRCSKALLQAKAAFSSQIQMKIGSGDATVTVVDWPSRSDIKPMLDIIFPLEKKIRIPRAKATP